MKRLLSVGFSPALTKQLLEKMPAGQSLEKVMKWVRAAIAHNLRVADPARDIIDQGGVFALVGPTGVGKTTTVAKLAARAVLKHGASKVAMVTTDSYRIGAQDQLRIYGRILGTPVFAVRDENELELTLLDLQGKHLVFVDTIGMSQRDRRVTDQIALLCGNGRPVRRLLLLGAPSQGITLEEVVRAYGGPGLTGCILTKIDEALTYGPVLDAVIRHQLTVHYVTNGQRVPEDLHLANAMYLVDRAFRLGGVDAIFSAEDEDYPVLMAAAEANSVIREDQDIGQGAFGATG
jgi:flagellar biosynthesis protein FlhF